MSESHLEPTLELLSSIQKSDEHTNVWKHIVQCHVCNNLFTVVTSTRLPDPSAVQCLRCLGGAFRADDSMIVTITINGAEYTLPTTPDVYEAKELCAFLMLHAHGLDKQDLGAMLDLIARVKSSSSMSAMGTTWHEATDKLIEFWSQERNLEQLLVFNRFCWTFGDFDTWKATSKLDDLLATAFHRAMHKETFINLRDSLAKCPKWNWWKRRSLERRMAEVLERVQENLDQLDALLFKLVKQDARWPDRPNLKRLSDRRISQ